MFDASRIRKKGRAVQLWGGGGQARIVLGRKSGFGKQKTNIKMSPEKKRIAKARFRERGGGDLENGIKRPGEKKEFKEGGRRKKGSEKKSPPPRQKKGSAKKKKLGDERNHGKDKPGKKNQRRHYPPPEDRGKPGKPGGPPKPHKKKKKKIKG